MLNIDRDRALSLRTFSTPEVQDDLIFALLTRNIMRHINPDTCWSFVDKKVDQLVTPYLNNTEMVLVLFVATLEGNLDWKTTQHETLGELRTLKVTFRWSFMGTVQRVTHEVEFSFHFMVKADSVKFDQENSTFEIIAVLDPEDKDIDQARESK